MKVTTKTVQDRITILENQKVISINESNTLSMLKWALEQQQRAETAEEKWSEWKEQAINAHGELTLAMAKLAELAPDESRWIPHDGMARPIGLDKDDLVYLRMKRQEMKLPYPAGMVNWKHDGGEFDVIAWASVNAPMRPADLVSEAVYTCTGCNHTSFHLPSSCDCGTEGARFIQHTAYLSPIAEQKGSERG